MIQFHRPLVPAAVVAILLAGCGSGDAEGDDGTQQPVDQQEHGTDDPAPAPIPDPVPNDCIIDVSPGEHAFACESLGFLCEDEAIGGTKAGCFHVTVPEQCVEHACGVILNVHGVQMTGPTQDAETNMSELGRRHDYIVVHPTANLGPNPLPGPDLVPSWQASDDPKVMDFLQRVIAAWHADQNRIHVTGFSQGGAMTWRLLCAHSDLFASFAPGAAGRGALGGAGGGASCDWEAGDPDPRRPVLFLHGTEDALSPHTVATSTANAIIAGWNLAGPETLSTDDAHTWSRYTSSDGDLFEFLEYDYTTSLALLRGHCFPGSTSGGILGCGQESAFVWGDVVMDFFLTHPKQ